MPSARSSQNASARIHFLSILVHPLDDARVLMLREFFVRIFDSYAFRASIGLLFHLCSRSTHVLFEQKKTGQTRRRSSSILPSYFLLSTGAKNCSELDGRTKNLIFENACGLLHVRRVIRMHENRNEQASSHESPRTISEPRQGRCPEVGSKSERPKN